MIGTTTDLFGSKCWPNLYLTTGFVQKITVQELTTIIISRKIQSRFFILRLIVFKSFFLMFILEFWQVFIVFKDFLFYFYVQIGFVCSFRVQIRTNIIKILIKNCIREKVCRAESGLTWCTRQCRRQQRPPRPPYTRDWSLSDHLMDDMVHSLTRTLCKSGHTDQTHHI